MEARKKGGPAAGLAAALLALAFALLALAPATLGDDGTAWAATTSYKLSYNGNGGQGYMAATSATGGTGVTVKGNVFTRTGYSFKEWNTSANGSGTKYAPGATLTLKSNVTLYAQWAQKGSAESGTSATTSYKLSYNGNGGQGYMAATSGTVVTLKANAFTRSGYKFSGWNTSADGKGTGYANGAIVTLTSNITLYAQWVGSDGSPGGSASADAWKVSFNGNGGQGYMAAQSIPKGSAANIKACAYSKSGYVFNGWNTSADGKGTGYANGASLKPSGNMTLYATWKASAAAPGGGVSGGGSNKYANNMRVGDYAKEVLSSTTAKGKVTLKGAVKPLTPDGKVTYKVASKDAKGKLSLNKQNGSITVKKNTAKGTYTMKVTVSAAGTSTRAAASKTVSVKVKVVANAGAERFVKAAKDEYALWKAGKTSKTKYTKWCGVSYQSWCSEFVGYCLEKAGCKRGKTMAKNPHCAGNHLNFYKSHPEMCTIHENDGSYKPKAGDVVIQLYGNSPGHTEMVREGYKNGSYKVYSGGTKVTTATRSIKDRSRFYFITIDWARV